MPVQLNNFVFSPNPLPRDVSTVTIQCEASVSDASENPVLFQLTFNTLADIKESDTSCNASGGETIAVKLGPPQPLPSYTTMACNRATAAGRCNVTLTAIDNQGGVYSLNTIINYD